MKPWATFRYLLHCDSAQSVLGGSSARAPGYECFGWRVPDGTLRLAFNGAVREPAGGYLLGNGYRLYSPVLRRFCSPDNLSPFKDGGINAYAYCKAEPANATDPSGHIRLSAKFPKGFTGGRARGLPQTGKPQQTLPTIKEYEAFNKKPNVFRHLNDRESWTPLRNRHANLKKKIGRAFDNGVPEPVMNNRVDRALAELADIEHQFAGMFGDYRIQNGLSRQLFASRQLPASLSKTVGHDQFALNVTLQELNAIKPIFSAASARQFISNPPGKSMNALRQS
jgi:RHS repeat-associated protein